MSFANIESLHVYPVKSAAGIDLQSAEITPTGFAHDREFVTGYYSKLGKFMFASQRSNPELTLLQTDLSEHELILSAEGIGEIRLPLAQDESQPEIEVDIFDKTGTGRDKGDKASEFLNDFFATLNPRNRKSNPRLLQAVTPRLANPKYGSTELGNKIWFSDGAPFLFASSVSLSAFNNLLEKPISMRRIRPNVVFGGSDLEPYVEDSWEDMLIGDVAARAVWSCARCIMLNNDPETGIKDPGQPITRMLEVVRSGIRTINGESKTEFYLGQNVKVDYEPGQRMTVGDRIAVLSYKQPDFTPII